ncbi:uncharacterized protein CC84DRAFT_1207214 [Paraphaeosphaeria sporulosa]|uniref:F-box domain-containing protein n=1 Tax=Paraphaeosphaeria sporulosa TaxID=1460663 RepID=A0A177CAW7_9PLEO|nr:uncharacterized protein CC84DRAFT_1207214 [Paraphaeosphaeria sporulosa]OAG03989.1 hypothetical protein CC84DRAFT_1207214 [Paraphaeosphaeria sporulosa]
MAPFDDLPVELTEAIIVITPLRDLSNLSKTCKRIRAIALRTMFRRIDFQWNSNNPRGPPVTALLRSILENPDLGKNVKEVVLQAVNYRGFQAPGFNGDILLPAHTHRIPAYDWEMFEKALEGCPCEEKGECDDPTTREGNLNAGIGVLISYCTRVESLSIDIELLMHNYRLPAMLRSTLYRYLGPWGKQSWFEKLNQVTITHTDAHYRTPRDHGRNEANYAENLPVPTQTYLYLFYLPNVKTLDMSFFPNVSASEGIQKDTLRHTVWPFPKAPLAFTLTTLRLRRSPALPETLMLLLATTPSLVTLDYDMFVPFEKAPVCLATLRQALEYVRFTLKDLAVRIEIFGDLIDEVGGLLSDHELSVPACVNALGSLRDFHALTSLETSFAVLFGQDWEPKRRPLTDLHSLGDLLPSNLQRLVLSDDLWAVSYLDCWTQLTALCVLRRFFAGQTLEGEWPDRAIHETRDRAMNWVADRAPEWKRATPNLVEFFLDFSKRGWVERGYIGRADQRESLKQVCIEQGISCEVECSTYDLDDHPCQTQTI